MSIQHMLVPVGLDDRDALVLRYVCGLGVQSVSNVTVATAIDATGMEAPVLMHEIERSRQELIEMSTGLRQCGMNVDVRVVTGDAESQMIAVAQQTGIDVICCGTEGKSLADYLFSGSISEDIFSAGRIRTMTVRYEQLESTQDPADLGRHFADRLVIPVDFSASSTRALLSAFDRPAAALGELHVLHVLGEGESPIEAEVLLRGAKDIAEERCANAVMVMRQGDPADEVMKYLNEVEATGCVTGQRGRGGRLQRTVLGSVSLRLLRNAPCPVVVQP